MSRLLRKPVIGQSAEAFIPRPRAHSTVQRPLDRGDLFVAQAREVAHLDDLALPRVLPGEPGQRLVQRDHVDVERFQGRVIGRIGAPPAQLSQQSATPTAPSRTTCGST